MTIPLMDPIPFVKIVIVLAVTFGIAVGLCGLSGTLRPPMGPDPSEEFGGGLLGVGSMIVMLLSAAGLLLTGAAWFLAAIIGGLSPRGSDVQRLFDDKADANGDKKR